MLLSAFLLAVAVQSPATTATPATHDGADLLPVNLSGRWGYVTAEGSTAIPFRYTMARPFREGLAAVRDADGWSFLRPDGSLAFPGRFRRARDFHEGAAAVVPEADGDERWSFLDRQGRPLGDGATWLEVGDYSEGMAAVLGGVRGGYLDASGGLVLVWGFVAGLPSPFSGGAAAYDSIRVGLSIEGETVGTAIDRDGQPLFEVEGRLRRIPGGYLQRPSGVDDAVRVLGDDGAPRHESWFEAAAVPLQPGPVPVRVDGRWGYLAGDGSFLVPPSLAEAFPFSDGLAAARPPERSFGYLGADGSWRLEPAFAAAGDFRDGRASVKIGDEVVWIDASGALLWNPQQAPAQDWELAVAAERSGQVVGALEVLGSEEPEPITLGEPLFVARTRHQALARARGRSGAEVLVDAGVDTETHFAYAFDLSWFTVGVAEVHQDFLLAEDDLAVAVRSAFSGDLQAAMAEVNDERIALDLKLMRLLDRDLPGMSGKLRVDAPKFFDCTTLLGAVPLELHSIGPHGDAPSRPRELLPMPFDPGTGVFTYWDPVSFGTAFPGEFEDARPFSEGLAAVRRGGRYGFLDLKGTMVIEPRFANTAAFSEGWCVVSDPDTGLLGYVDRAGAMALPCRFEAVGDFHQDRAMIRLDGGWGFLGRDGELAIPARYQGVGNFAAGLAPFQQDGKVGYLGLDGAVVVPAQYQSGSTHVEGLATAVDAAGGMHYLDAAGGRALSGAWDFASDFLDGAALVREAGTAQWSLIGRDGATLSRVEEQE